MPCTAADEAVAFAVVHLTGKAVGITPVVGIIVTVMVRVAVDDVVVGTIGTIVLADAWETVAELVAKT